MTLRVLTFRDSIPRIPESRAIREFTVTARLTELAAAIAAGAQALLEEVGEDEYLRQWGYPFPKEALAAVQTHL